MTGAADDGEAAERGPLTARCLAFSRRQRLDPGALT